MARRPAPPLAERLAGRSERLSERPSARRPALSAALRALTPKFHHYVVEERVPSYAWVGHPHVVVGDVLPAEGVVLYPVPSEYGVTEYRYTVVDDTPVLVDPRTRRVVQVIE